MQQGTSSKRYTNDLLRKQRTAAWRISIQLFFVFFLIYLAGQAWFLFQDLRVSPVAELHVDRERWLAAGGITQVWTAEAGIFINVSDAGTFALMREFSSPEAANGIWLTQDPYYVLAVYDQGSSALVVEDETRLYQLDLTKHVPVFSWDARVLGEDCRILSADKMTNGNLLLGLDLKGEQVIYCVSPKGELSPVTMGTRPTAHPTQPRFYFVREQMVYARNLVSPEETPIIAGEQVAVSRQGNYLCVVGVQGESVLLLQEKKPQNPLTISYSDQRTPDYAYLSLAWDQDDTIYAVRSAARAPAEVVSYHLHQTAALPEKIGALWAEGRADNNLETIARTFPQDPQLLDDADFRDTVLGYEISDRGMHQQGQYVMVDWQIYTQGQQRLLQQQLYLENLQQGYSILNYLAENLTSYVIKAGVLYEEKNGEEVSVGSLPETTEAYAYNPSFKEYLYVAEDQTGRALFLGYRNKPERSPRRFELPFSATAEIESLALNQAGDIAALIYSAEGKKQAALFALGSGRWVETPFLKDIERIYWRENDLIVFQQNAGVQFRWRYDPWHGNLGMDMP